MRCPYCNGVNNDRSVYCTYCGRNMTVPPKNQPASRPTVPAQGQARPTGYPPTPQPTQPRQMPLPQQPQRQPSAQTVSAQATRVRQQPTPVAPFAPPIPPAPEPPVPFPPRTFTQLQALDPGALAYTVVNTTIGNGRKKIVRIAYQRCAQWQQVATLLKALKEQQEAKYESIIIQGVYPQDSDVYEYTNGQLQLDRNVLLGSQVLNRYQIETGTGLESDALRIVLSDE